MIKEFLVCSSMRLGVPFIALMQLGAIGSNPGRQFLPSVEWRTRQSGAPPDRHCSVSGVDCFPKLAQLTVEDLEPLAHQTVRCPHLTVGSTTCHARIARPTVGSADRWLTGQSGAPPDSPVIFSRTPPSRPESSQLTRRQPGAPDTVRCTTGHCPVYPDCAEFWLLQPSLFPFVFSLILALRQIC
jgi:hypothetical protein